MRNRFITVEGLDGSGKTTILSKIVKYLNIHHIENIITTHEPGGTFIANTLKTLIKYGSLNESISDIAELLMIYAARSQLLENIIKPALAKGYWIIGDRYDLSSYAYQGGGRKIDISFLDILSQKVTKNLSPDLIFYLDVAPKVGLSRIKIRRELDQIEQESIFFFDRVRKFYQKIAALQSNIVIIDANQNLNKVSMDVCQYLDWWLLNLD